MKDPSLIYDQEWFTQFPPLRAEFRATGEALHEQFMPRTVLDVGCGPGMVIERMQELGCKVAGWEGSVHGIAIASDAVRDKIEHRDITLGGVVPAVDLVICTEVAEHLEAQHARTLVRMLAEGMGPRGHIFFTAAPPGQGGHDHVNEQPKAYWLDLFAIYGVSWDKPTTLRVLERMKAKISEWAQSWYWTNAMVLHRP